MIDYVIMNVTNGNLVGDVYETREEAEEWIENQEVPEMYDVIERD